MSVRRAVYVVLLALVGLVLPATAPASAAAPKYVLPATATPHGISLTEMLRKSATFNSSSREGSDLRYYPDTPIAMLFTEPATSHLRRVDGGGVIVNRAEHHVRAGQHLYVPTTFIDDSAPVLGTFPRTHEQALPYVFGQSGIGLDNYSIIVDGLSTRIGRSYLAGPVRAAVPFPPGAPAADQGRHMVMLGAFLAPLSPGRHTVEVVGNGDGTLLLQQISPLKFLRTDITYTVIVA